MVGLKSHSDCYREAGRGEHWSRVFYADARAKGYRFAARAHRPGFVEGADSGEDLQAFHDEQELYRLPFVQRFKDADPAVRFESTPYASDGERLIVAHLPSGTRLVVAYLVDLRAAAT